ncbi:hypothetical protein HanIR_Chr10g0488871 [Helianthus annuus]|nr:hypothetical protein HanIR_Chr10g0488871 [Helianthus annuus]
MMISSLAVAYWNGTGGSIRSASYTADLVNGIFSKVEKVTSPSVFTTDLISSANRRCKVTPPVEIHLISDGNKTFMPPNALKAARNTRL